MALCGMRNVYWGFGEPQLLEDITFQIKKGDRACLVGRNGEGKSTILKLLGGEILSDSGEVWKQQGTKIAMLRQEVPGKFKGTIFDLVAHGLGKKGELLAEHIKISKKGKAATPHELARRDKIQQTLDFHGGWELLRQIEKVLSHAGLDPEKNFFDLSAGMKRRALFTRAIALEPDILLLDEPTNHLDIDTIAWMEEFILSNIKTLFFTTHDRAFLKKIATKIIELDRGRIFTYNSDYETYLKQREIDLNAEKKSNNVFDKKLSTEETWIRQGIKARRTRNEGRVRALQKMREAYRTRRKKIGNVKFQLHDAQKTGKLVIKGEKINFSLDNIPIIKDFSTTIMRGDKVGIIGKNGIGKTTLLKILLKEIPPDSGTIRHGTNLKAVYFDQLRALLDEEKTVAENIGEGNDFIVINGHKRHVVSHLQDFLFSKERCRTKVHVLSGGEKNRLLLAKLFTKPANLFILDEPTNDLDAETLELLEELIFNYTGTLLLVSHDRAFLNNVVTSTMVFEEKGQIVEYAGGYDDWLLQRPKPEKNPQPETIRQKSIKPKPKLIEKEKLGYMEQRELTELPKKIDLLESEQKDLYSIVSDPDFYKKGKKETISIQKHLQELEQKIEAAYLRWENLESR